MSELARRCLAVPACTWRLSDCKLYIVAIRAAQGPQPCTDGDVADCGCCMQRIVQYDQPLGLNSMRELNPAMQTLTAALDTQLEEVSFLAVKKGAIQF